MSTRSTPGRRASRSKSAGQRPRGPRRLIGDSDHQVAIAAGRRRRQQQRSQGVLVDPSRVANPPFEGGKRRREELRLPEQPFGATVDVAAGGELFADDAIEAVDGAASASQLVVEREDRGHESRTKIEWWRAPPRRARRLPPAAGGLRARTPTASPERRAGGRAGASYSSPRLTRSGRMMAPPDGRRQAPVLDGAAQLLGGAAARDDDRRRTRGPAIGDRVDDRRLEDPEIGGADQPGDAGGDQRAGCGACVIRLSSAMAWSASAASPRPPTTPARRCPCCRSGRRRVATSRPAPPCPRRPPASNARRRPPAAAAPFPARARQSAARR